MNYILVGNYGVGNLGDEALKEYFLKHVPEVQWTVLGEDLPRLPFGLRSLLGTRWWKTLGAIRRSNGIVFGGGSLFTDVESSYACFLWWWHAFIAKLFGKPILLAFQGIGSFKTRGGEWCARWVVSKARFISVRDEESAKRIVSWKMNTKVIQSFDPIFSIIEGKNTMDRSKKVFIAIPRHNSSDSFTKRFQEILQKRWGEVHILSFQPENARERGIAEKLRGLSPIPAVVIPIKSLADFSREVGQGTFVLTERYHGAIAALALEIPLEIVSQGDGDKLESLKGMQDRGISAEELRRKVLTGEEALRKALKNTDDPQR